MAIGNYALSGERRKGKEGNSCKKEKSKKRGIVSGLERGRAGIALGWGGEEKAKKKKGKKKEKKDGR